MILDDAQQLMRMMNAAFHFDEDSNLLWAQKLVDCVDSEAAWKTCHALIEGAEDRYTPAWGEFKATYTRWVERHIEERAENQLAIDRETYSRQRFPTYEEGVAIAIENYRDHCKMAGKEPNAEHIAAWLGFGREDRRRVASATRQRR